MNFEKEHKKRKIPARILTVIFLCMFLFSLYKVADILREYSNIAKLYDEANATYTSENGGGMEEAPFDVDFEKLHAVNSDVIGWIYIPGTDISFPLLQGEDNNQYLYHSYEKKWIISGSIFIDSRCNSDFRDRNTVIYGHNMHNGSMFGNLKKYKSEKYAQNHRDIYVMKSDGEWNRYEVVAYYQAEVDGATYVLPLRETGSDSGEIDKDREIKTSISTQENFNTLIDTIKSSNVYEAEADIDEEERLITLSTCTQDSRNDVRMILAAKLIETNY